MVLEINRDPMPPELDSFVLRPDKQPFTIHRGFGPCCDAAYADVPSTFRVKRHSMVWLPLTNGGPATDASIAAGAAARAFSYGVGESAAPGGLGITASPVETDAFNTGAVVQSGFGFYATGMEVEVQQPHQLIAGARHYPKEITDPASLYDDAIRQAFLANLWLEFEFGQTACKYRLGAPGDWATMSGARGPNVSNGQTIATMYMPFSFPMFINARDEVRKLTIGVKVAEGAGIVLENNAAQALPALNANPLYVPLRISLIGVQVCVANGGACGVPDGGNMQQMVAAAVAAALAARG